MFNELIRQFIEPILSRHGVKIVNEQANVVDFAGDSLFVRFASDKRENLIYLYVGPSINETVLFDNDILRTIFGSYLEIDRAPLSEFARNIAFFFKNEGISLLTNSDVELEKVINYQEKRSEEYTASIRRKQFKSLI